MLTCLVCGEETVATFSGRCARCVKVLSWYYRVREWPNRNDGFWTVARARLLRDLHTVHIQREGEA